MCCRCEVSACERPDAAGAATLCAEGCSRMCVRLEPLVGGGAYVLGRARLGRVRTAPTLRPRPPCTVRAPATAPSGNEVVGGGG